MAYSLQIQRLVDSARRSQRKAKPRAKPKPKPKPKPKAKSKAKTSGASKAAKLRERLAKLYKQRKLGEASKLRARMRRQGLKV